MCVAANANAYVIDKALCPLWVFGHTLFPSLTISCLCRVIRRQDHSHSHDHKEVGDGTTTAAKRFGIDNFVYRQRRPFHPERLGVVLKVRCFSECTEYTLLKYFVVGYLSCCCLRSAAVGAFLYVVGHGLAMSRGLALSTANPTLSPLLSCHVISWC